MPDNDSKDGYGDVDPELSERVTSIDEADALMRANSLRQDGTRRD